VRSKGTGLKDPETKADINDDIKQLVNQYIFNTCNKWQLHTINDLHLVDKFMELFTNAPVVMININSALGSLSPWIPDRYKQYCSLETENYLNNLEYLRYSVSCIYNDGHSLPEIEQLTKGYNRAYDVIASLKAGKPRYIITFKKKHIAKHHKGPERL
jgi:hypothetical protein